MILDSATAERAVKAHIVYAASDLNSANRWTGRALRYQRAGLLIAAATARAYARKDRQSARIHLLVAKRWWRA